MDNVVAAIISVGGVIASIIVSYIIAKNTSKYNYNYLYAEIVSKSRNNWLNEFRENVSVMLAEGCKCCTNYKSGDFYRAFYHVQIKLNSKEYLHELLREKINELEQCRGYESFTVLAKEITSITEQIIKQEWERVKKEAKGESV